MTWKDRFTSFVDINILYTKTLTSDDLGVLVSTYTNIIQYQ